MKISRLIFLSIFFILAMFSFTTFINYRQSEEVRENAEFLALSSVVVRQSNQIQRNILYMERGLRGYLMTNETYFMQLYDSASIENERLFQDLSALLPPQSAQSEMLVSIRQLYDTWDREVADPLREARRQRANAPGQASLNRFYEDSRLVQQEERINRGLQQEFRALLNIEYGNREQRKAILQHSETQTKVISFCLTALSIIVGLVIAFFLARHIRRRIQKMVDMANSISKGDYSVHVNEEGSDELGNLTRSLNEMAGILDENMALLRRKNRELDQFAHIVSHDLKAPLRGIGNVISWIEEDHFPEIPARVKDYLQLIKGRADRLENLIQGILNYARVGKERQEKEVIPLSDLVNEVWQNLPLRPGLSLCIQPNLPVIRSEKLPLEQIFTNLLSNAIKYHDKPEGEIKVYSREESDHYVFFVEDDGPGIARQHHDKIFIIFQTLQERDSFESTGVGLAIVKKILDDRWERIELVSGPVRGSVFSFTWSKS